MIGPTAPPGTIVGYDKPRCEDKNINMSSLFAKKRDRKLPVLSLPPLCVPTEEDESLRTKRAAQLEWMRANGIRSLLSKPVTRNVTWADLLEESPRTLPAQRIAERCVAALHSLRRLNAKQIQSARKHASGQAA
jgi:hypothetical protein